MSDSGVLSQAFDSVKDAGKGLITGTADEINKGIGQGIAQVTGAEPIPTQQETQSNILQFKQKEATETPIRIQAVEQELKMERMKREERQKPPEHIAESSKPAMVNLVSLIEKKRDNRENKIAAA